MHKAVEKLVGELRESRKTRLERLEQLAIESRALCIEIDSLDRRIGYLDPPSTEEEIDNAGNR